MCDISELAIENNRVFNKNWNWERAEFHIRDNRVKQVSKWQLGYSWANYSVCYWLTFTLVHAHLPQ